MVAATSTVGRSRGALLAPAGAGLARLPVAGAARSICCWRSLAGEVVRPLLRRFPGDAGRSRAEARPRTRRPAPGAAGAASQAAASTGCGVRRDRDEPPPSATPGGTRARRRRERTGTRRPGAPRSPPSPRGGSSSPARSPRAPPPAAAGTVGARHVRRAATGPRVKRVTVPLAKLPRAAHGYRIAVVSDIHLGPVLGRGFAQRVVDTINSTQPDLIAIVGDLVDGSVEDLGPAAAPLRAAAGPARLVLRHRQPRVLLRRRAVGRARPRAGRAPAGERAHASCPASTSPGSTTSRARDERRGPGLRQGARRPRHRPRRPCCSPTSPCRSTTPSTTASTSSSPATPTAASSGPATHRGAGQPDRRGPGAVRRHPAVRQRGAGAWGPPVRVGAESDITVVELASKKA